MNGNERTLNVCGALWRLFNADRPRSEVGVDDVMLELKESGYSREDVDTCIRQDKDLHEIIRTAGFSKIMREELILA